SAESTCTGRTVPATAKLNGSSFGSLLLNDISPANVPTVPVSSRTVKLSDCPGPSAPDSPSAIENPLGTLNPERSSVASPSLVTVNVSEGAGEPCVVGPN